MMDAPEPQDGIEQAGGIDRELDEVNADLSAWAARSAAESDALIERFEAMGYAVRGKTEEEIAQILRRPPGRRADR